MNNKPNISTHLQTINFSKCGIITKYIFDKADITTEKSTVDAVQAASRMGQSDHGKGWMSNKRDIYPHYLKNRIWIKKNSPGIDQKHA